MKALVTGSSGFLGTALVARLLKQGHDDIRCFLRPGSDPSRLRAVARWYPTARIQLFVGTLASREGAERALEGVDVVFHLAAGMTGAPAEIFSSTVVASKNLLDAVTARRDPPRVVLVSSFGVYGVGDLPRGHVVDESTPLEPHPEKRDAYSHAKLRQERLFWEARRLHGLSLVVLRPGVIYGPRRAALSARVGLSLGGLFLHLGGDNLLPLSYVDNCAEAVALAANSERAVGHVFNVHDDDLPTCRKYLEGYRRHVPKTRSLRIPYFAMQALSRLAERYHDHSRGQLPAVLTPYKTATAWKGNRFDNRKLKSLGWKPITSTEEGMRRTFESLRSGDT